MIHRPPLFAARFASISLRAYATAAAQTSSSSSVPHQQQAGRAPSSSSSSQLATASSSSSTVVTASDQKEAAAKIWGSLHASSNALTSAQTGSAGTARITHNLNYSNAKWQASCVEVRPRIRDGETDEEKINPVITKRNKQFGQIMPWEKKAWENKTKFPKSDKFPPDDDVEIVFYFETHGLDGVGLKGYQHIAARVSEGELPGECCNLTASGGFATWTVPRSEFVALTESTPLLGDMLNDTPPKKPTCATTEGGSSSSQQRPEERKNDLHGKNASEVEGVSEAFVGGEDGTASSRDRTMSSEKNLRKITMRMSNSTDRARHDNIPEASVVNHSKK